jgi:hypothetical protein
VGDVFVIPLVEDSVAVGQVLAERVRGMELLVGVFAGAHQSDQAMHVASSAPFALLGSTLDALFMHDRWQVVGRTKPRRDVRLPTFKVAVAPGQFIEEAWDGTRLRDLPPGEANNWAFRKVVAPIRIEKAIKAMLGLAEWNEAYDALLAPVSD